MGFAAWIAREIRFIARLARTLWRVRGIDPNSDWLICDDFEAAIDKYADHTALVFEDERLTYRQLEALANRFAAWGQALGLVHGDIVALFLPNRAEYVPAWMGIAKQGAAAALINSNLTGAALAHCLSISGATHVITDRESLAAFETLRAGLARPLTLWVIDADNELGGELGPEHFPPIPNRSSRVENAQSQNLRPFSDRPGYAEAKLQLRPGEKTAHTFSENGLGRRGLDLKTPRLAPPRPDRSQRAGLKARDVALYIYTSGTTGMPKAAKITHARAQLYMRGFAGATGAGAADRVYCALPLYHSTGGLCGVGAALLNGATLVLQRKFSATHFWDDIAEHGCTIFVYIGELCRYLVNQPPHPKERAHALKLAFGNGLRPDIWGEFQQRFGVARILEFYGSTEGNVSLFNFDGKAGAIGRVPAYLRNNFLVRLVRFDLDAEAPLRGPDGLCIECAVGEIGEAIGLIGGDARQEYSGYADKAASERKILRDAFKPGDAWFRTGDLMRQDADGYFYFIDRIGDTFRWKGENVSTTEVAEAIGRYPAVLEVNVYGVSIDKLDGRAGMAAITPGDGFELAGLRDFIARELPSFARPLFVRLQPAIETTGTFKYRKIDLVRDGFDPAKTEHELYFDHPEQHRYTRLTPELYAQIQRGVFRL